MIFKYPSLFISLRSNTVLADEAEIEAFGYILKFIFLVEFDRQREKQLQLGMIFFVALSKMPKIILIKKQNIL